MNFPSEVLEITNHHANEVIRAEQALQDGFITRHEYAVIAALAADWDDFVLRLRDMTDDPQD